MELTHRPRRLRTCPEVRSLCRETRLSPDSLIYPIFVDETLQGTRPIPSLPGQFHYGLDSLCQAVEECLAHGVTKCILFGLPAHKDEIGSSAWDDNGVVQQAIRTIKAQYPHFYVIADVCMCEYTSHGHCGILCGEHVDNDATLEGGAVYAQDPDYGQVLYLDGDSSDGWGGHDSYLAFPEGFFDGMDSVTISMDVKEVTRWGNFFTFTIGQDNQKYLFLKTMPTNLKLAITTGSYSTEQIASWSGAYPDNSRTWINLKLVVTRDSISIYRDGELVAEKQNTGISISDLGDNLKAYLGKSFYGEDLYFRGYFDNVKVFDYAMSEWEVKIRLCHV